MPRSSLERITDPLGDRVLERGGIVLRHDHQAAVRRERGGETQVGRGGSHREAPPPGTGGRFGVASVEVLRQGWRHGAAVSSVGAMFVSTSVVTEPRYPGSSFWSMNSEVAAGRAERLTRVQIAAGMFHDLAEAGSDPFRP